MDGVALHMDRPDQADPHYDRIAKAITFAVSHAAEQPSLEVMAAEACLSSFHFQRLFKRRVGISPKKFLQYVTLNHAKRALGSDASVLDTALDIGLSGPSRLHDLFVSMEAITPGDYKAMGTSLVIRYGFHWTPLGKIMLAVTERGICWLAFVTDDGADARQEFEAVWAHATRLRDDEATSPYAARIFDASRRTDAPILLNVRGTNFQIKVWEALLTIPYGQLSTYRQVAEAAGNPAAVRATASAIARNPIAWLIPCHRVILATGVMHNYRWGRTQKKLLNTVEAAIAAA